MTLRSPLVDGLKVLATQLIVLHHVVLYAPMAGRLAPAWPRSTAWLIDEARFVVQVFLVIGGFLAAQSLSHGVGSLPRALLARYLRLAPMLAVALLAVLAASTLLPLGRWPEWVTPWPTPAQFIAQLLLLQDVLDIPSLSAGLWYVAIDFQLYALLASGAALLHRRALPWAVAALTLASLWVFNRDAALDAWAPYFFSAYGLGALAAWAGRSRVLAALFAGVCTLHLGTAWLQQRPRVALAGLTAVALATLARRWRVRGRLAGVLAFWSDASYSVFVMHYAVIVAMTALWLWLDLASPAAASSLLLLTWATSLAAGAALQHGVSATMRQPHRPKARQSAEPGSTAPLPR